jgi:hypothetical protein
VIAVTVQGKRFGNEGNSYHDFVQDLVRACKGHKEVSCWLLCDHRTLRQYGLGCVAPFPVPIGRHLRTGYLQRGATQPNWRAQSASMRCSAGHRNSLNTQRARGPDFGRRQGLQPLPGRR